MVLQSKYFKRSFMVLGLVIICLTPVALQPDIGAAQADKAIAVIAYAEAMNIDYAEAERRLILQDEMSLVEQQIAMDEAYFASWIRHRPNFGLVVSFTTADGQERISKYLEGVEWADLVTVQQSDITSAMIAYAEGLNIDYAEAEWRLSLQDEMSRVMREIEQDEAYFAAWLQHQPTFGLVVSFTTADGQERISKYLEGVEWADLVTVQQSDITREALLSLRRQVVQAARKTGLNFGSGIDDRTGKVNLYTDKVDELRSRLGTQLAARAEGAAIMSRIKFVEEAMVVPAPDIEAAQADKAAAVIAYAEAMNIAYAEAERRLILQGEMIRVGREIEQDEAYFAAWLEHQPTIGLVVSFTTADGQERISKYLEGVEWADLVTVQQSDITREALLSLRRQVVQAARKTGLNFGSGIDDRTGQVNLYTDKVDELRSRLGTQLAMVVPAPDIEAAQPDKAAAVIAYAEAMNIAYAEAERRLILQGEMIRVGREIEQDEAYFAAWLEHQPTIGLVVSFTTADGQERISKYLEGVEWADLVTVQQSDITREALLSLRRQVVQAARKTGLNFGSGIDDRTGQVNLYTDKVDELRSRLGTQLAARAEGAAIMSRIKFVEQTGDAPADYEYPHLLGGHAITTCTSGFVVYRVSDDRRFISTSGHCANAQDVKYNGVNAVYLGDVVWENNISGIGPHFGNDLDFQVHEAAEARSFDLTNLIKASTATSPTATQRVIGTGNAWRWAWVCKHGQETGHTCGFVTDLTYTSMNPVQYGNSNAYVRVDRLGFLGNIACRGDSGSPVYRYEAGSVYAWGILSSSNGGDCTGNAGSIFAFSPIDQIHKSPYRILTTDYPQYLYQNIFKSAADCTEYRTPVAPNGSPLWPQTTTQPCRTSAPGSGSINTYTAIVTSNLLREAIWQGGVGYVRNVPLQDNGEVDWHAAPNWTQCCTSTTPYVQGAYVIGDHVYQSQFWADATCTEYETPLDEQGAPIWNQTRTQVCRTFAPGSGTVGTYTAVVTGEYLREAIWRGGIGYVRDIPLNDTNTEANWNAAPDWRQCCTGTTPEGQGAYVLTHP